MAEPIYTYYRSSTQNALWGFAIGLLLLLGFVLWIVLLVQFPQLAFSNVAISAVLIYLFLAIAAWLVCGVQITIAFTSPYRYRFQLYTDRLVSVYESSDRRECVELPLNQIKAVRKYHTFFLIPGIHYLRFVDHAGAEHEIYSFYKEPLRVLLEKLPGLNPKVVYEVAEVSGQTVYADGQTSDIVESIRVQPWPDFSYPWTSKTLEPGDGPIYAFSSSSLRSVVLAVACGVLVILGLWLFMLLSSGVDPTRTLGTVVMLGFFLTCGIGVLLVILIGAMVFEWLSFPYRCEFALSPDRLRVNYNSKNPLAAKCQVDLQLDQIHTLRIYYVENEKFIHQIDCMTHSGDVIRIAGDYNKPLQALVEKLPALNPKVVFETVQVAFKHEIIESGGTQGKFGTTLVQKRVPPEDPPSSENR